MSFRGVVSYVRKKSLDYFVDKYIMNRFLNAYVFFMRYFNISLFFVSGPSCAVFCSWIIFNQNFLVFETGKTTCSHSVFEAQVYVSVKADGFNDKYHWRSSLKYWSEVRIPF